MRRANVLFLGDNCEHYESGYYHDDLLQGFRLLADTHAYGAGYPGYDPQDTIEDVIAKSPFDPAAIDLVVCGTAWGLNVSDAANFEERTHPRIRLDHLRIPKAYYLNKEYNCLDLKLEYARRNRFDAVLTVHNKWEEWQRDLGIPFLYSPFGLNTARFAVAPQRRVHDVSFLGGLHKEWMDDRVWLKTTLFKPRHLHRKSNLGRENRFHLNVFQKPFGKLKIYWAEFGAVDRRGASLTPHGLRYAEILASSTSSFNTLSAVNIFNCRFFELMHLGTLIVCPRTTLYPEFLRDGETCLMFDRSAEDLWDKLRTVRENGASCASIRETARATGAAYPHWRRAADALAHFGFASRPPA